MRPHGLLTLLALAATVALAGCVDFDAHGRSHGADGDCWATQGPAGQGAGCSLGGNGCQAEQSWAGQGGSCRFSG